MLITKYPIAGALLGYIGWLILLESEKMGNIVFRKDFEGNAVFSPRNIFNMMLGPFKHAYFWGVEFWQHNWILMCIGGIAIEYVIYMQK